MFEAGTHPLKPLIAPLLHGFPGNSKKVLRLRNAHLWIAFSKHRSSALDDEVTGLQPGKRLPLQAI